MSKELSALFKKVLFQKGQKELTSAPFYIDGNKVAITAFANGTGLPPGARIKFQELVYIDGGRTDGTLCVPGKMNGSILCDCKPLMSCGCEPTLTERNNYIELDRPGWFRAVYEGPSRQSVMVVARELVATAGTGCCVSACCPIEVDLTVTKSISSPLVPLGAAAAFTLTIENKGPEASKGGSVKDVLPAGLVLYTAPLAVFSGGAVGTQPTLASLNDGSWLYTLLPVGGKIVITVPFTVMAASLVPQVNTAQVNPGTGESETNWADNASTVFYMLGVPPATLTPEQTQALVDAALVPYATDAEVAAAIAAAVILLQQTITETLGCGTGIRYTGPVQATSNVPGINTVHNPADRTRTAILALPSMVVVNGVLTHEPVTNMNQPPPLTWTNSRDCAELVTVTYRGGDNYSLNGGITYGNEKIGFFHTLSSTFLTTPPYAGTYSSGQTLNLLGWGPTDPMAPGSYPHTRQDFVPLILEKVLQPGESLTAYAQTWVYFYADYPIPDAPMSVNIGTSHRISIAAQLADMPTTVIPE